MKNKIKTKQGGNTKRKRGKPEKQWGKCQNCRKNEIGGENQRKFEGKNPEVNEKWEITKIKTKWKNIGKKENAKESTKRHKKKVGQSI